MVSQASGKFGTQMVFQMVSHSCIIVVYYMYMYIVKINSQTTCKGFVDTCTVTWWVWGITHMLLCITDFICENVYASFELKIMVI